jgi:hypothetical protein
MDALLTALAEEIAYLRDNGTEIEHGIANSLQRILDSIVDGA